MPTVKEKLEEKFTGQIDAANGLYSEEVLQWDRAQQALMQTAPFAAFLKAKSDASNLRLETLRIKCERDAAIKKLDKAERELAAAEHACEVLGSVQVP